MSQDTNVNNLIINKLTKEQYESITPSDTELYLVTDDIGITSSDIITTLGYTPENQANKITALSSASTDTQYPSAKVTYDGLSSKVNKSDLIDVVCVVDEYQSGDVWIRTWSDGMIEQWCNDITYSSAAAHSFVFPIQYASMPLIIINYFLAATATTGITVRNAGYARSASGFSVYFAANAHISYYARGY